MSTIILRDSVGDPIYTVTGGYIYLESNPDLCSLERTGTDAPLCPTGGDGTDDDLCPLTEGE